MRCMHCSWRRTGTRCWRSGCGTRLNIHAYGSSSSIKSINTMLLFRQLAEDGYAVLAERLREPAERAVVADVLQKTLNIQVRVLLLTVRMHPRAHTNGCACWFSQLKCRRGLVTQCRCGANLGKHALQNPHANLF